tara:strand:- start:11437 stop:11967 length:531 start_codon:yes stop_codon:yes gene_type:complete
MATSNFYNKNASRIFATETEGEFDYEDLVSNINYELRDLENSFSSGKAGDWIDNNSKVLDFSLNKSFDYKDGTSLECVIHPIIRSGYYSGVNLDWDFEFYIDGSEVEDDDCIKDYLIHFEGYAPSHASTVSGSRFRRLEKLRDILTEQLEKIFTDFTTPLVVTARFSNGETLYATA